MNKEREEARRKESNNDQGKKCWKEVKVKRKWILTERK